MKPIYFMLILLIIPITSAIDYNPIIKIEGCKNITIDVSSPMGIKTSDYNFSNCRRMEGNIDKWYCNCNITEDYTLGMLTKNGIDKTFVLGINYTYWYKNRVGNPVHYTKYNQGTLTVTSTTTTSTTERPPVIIEKECPKNQTKYIDVYNNCSLQKAQAIEEEHSKGNKRNLGWTFTGLAIGALMVGMVWYLRRNELKSCQL